MKTKRLKYGIIIGLLLVLSAMIIFTNSAHSSVCAEAGRQKVMTMQQTDSAVYCGKDYINVNGFFEDTDSSTTAFENSLFDTLAFYLDGERVYPDAKSVRAAKGRSVKDPQDYSINFTVKYEDIEYTVSAVSVKIDKKKVTVRTLLNGQTELVVNEGDKVNISYDYSGAVAAHMVLSTENGITVTRISQLYCSPAYVDYLPKDPIENYKVVAAYATSDFYTFDYIGAVLTIKSKTINLLSVTDNDETKLTLTGEFSSLYSVQYSDIGINPASVEYATINARLEDQYKATGFFDKYEKVACYSITVLSDNNTLYDAVPAKVLIKSDGLSADKTYKVIALYASGTVQNDILNAEYKDGYLYFEAKDMGDFMVVEAVEGMSTSAYMFVAVIGLIVLLLLVAFVAVFRRKY